MVLNSTKLGSGALLSGIECLIWQSGGMVWEWQEMGEQKNRYSKREEGIGFLNRRGGWGG